MFCLKTRKGKNLSIKGLHKWTIYITGLLETLILSSCVFGWAQLVHVLKNDEIFLDLCLKDGQNLTTSGNVSRAVVNETMKLHGCREQDEAFALIYTIGVFAFSAVGLLPAYSLLYLGLVITRIIYSTAIVIGFLTLGLTTKESPSWLYASIILMSIGGNGLRLSGLQFCHLFPKRKSTALTIISGSYSFSSSFFFLFQVGQNHGISLWTMSFSTALLASLSLFATALMPWHSIPCQSEERRSEKKLPFRNSFFSISFFTLVFAIVLLVFEIRFYTLRFNSWISKISRTNDEAEFYSSLYSLSSIVCPFITFLPGMLSDYLLKKAKSSSSNRSEQFQEELKVPVVMTTILHLLSMIIPGLLLVEHSMAIYISLAAIQILRPYAICIIYTCLKIRFPMDHFDRTLGVNQIVAAFMMLFQYHLFIWFQDKEIEATSFIYVLLFISLSSQFHLLFKKYRKKIAEERFPILEDQERTRDFQAQQSKGDQDDQEKDQEENEKLNVINI